MAGLIEPVTWRPWREVPRLCLRWSSLRSTLAVALVVGAVLFAIDQLDVVVAGDASGRVWLKAAVTLRRPLPGRKYGLLVGAHRVEPGLEQAGLSARLHVTRRKRGG